MNGKIFRLHAPVSVHYVYYIAIHCLHSWEASGLAKHDDVLN